MQGGPRAQEAGASRRPQRRETDSAFLHSACAALSRQQLKTSTDAKSQQERVTGNLLKRKLPKPAWPRDSGPGVRKVKVPAGPPDGNADTPDGRSWLLHSLPVWPPPRCSLF